MWNIARPARAVYCFFSQYTNKLPLLGASMDMVSIFLDHFLDEVFQLRLR